MFYLTARIGSMCAVYDDSDSTVEWCDKIVLKQYLSMGVTIEGVSGNTVKPVTSLKCDWRSCNWTKSKRNIFDVAEKVQITSGGIVVFAEGKKFKGKFINEAQGFMVTRFSNGLTVLIPVDWLNNNR